MRLRFPRRQVRPRLDLGRGERLLAWATTTDGEVVGATRDAAYLPGGIRVAWEQVEAADWDVDTEVLRICEVGTWGHERPEHEIVVAEPRRLLEMVRERVTASIVLQRHVPLRGRRGVRVIARRPPSGRGEIAWVYEFDEGIDPTDPFVFQAAEEALAEARAEVGDR